MYKTQKVELTERQWDYVLKGLVDVGELALVSRIKGEIIATEIAVKKQLGRDERSEIKQLR